ncbi:MAG: hypothetical protein ACFFE8_10140 [Candidatus Heimdallarchaeota archaeon]
MVSFDELETFISFLVFNQKGRLLLSKDFRKDVHGIPPEDIRSLLLSAYNISQKLDDEAISAGQIFHIDFASMRIAGIHREEALFSLIASASASLLDIEFKLRTLMTLFLGNFADKLALKNPRLSVVEKDDFDETIQTVVTGESRYMSESMKRIVDDSLVSWVENDDAVRGVCISSFTGAVIVNRMDVNILPAAVRAIRGAFAAHLEKPVFFLAASGVANIVVYILGEGLLLLVDANPEIPPETTVQRVGKQASEIRGLIL